MRIIQTFYDSMASQYDKLFLDWQAAAQEQAGSWTNASPSAALTGLPVYWTALAALGYPVTASDISEGELAQAKERAAVR